jgi:Baseplate J-like protein
MQAPRIDKRSYADIVAQTQQLAGQFSGWQPRPDGQPDAGQALIQVFGRFAELVVDRINRAPDKNYLAFLNLIGAAPLLPRAARVPLTFHLAAGSPVDAVIPAGALAAAPPLDGSQDDVIFETERSLVVTRAQLQAAFVSDTETDTYDDRSPRALGQAAEPFAVFTGDQPSPHQLYLACDPLLTQPGSRDVTLTLATPDTWPWLNWPISWACWDGAAWRTAASRAAVTSGSWLVTLPALPALIPQVINEIEAGWLRVQLDLPLPPGRSGQVPESIAIGARSPQDLTVPLSPFPADSPVQRFYLSADDAFAAAGAHVTIQIHLATPGDGPNIQLNWLYQAGDQWLPLGQSSAAARQTGATSFGFQDGTLAFTRDGEISFKVPMSWPRSLYRTRTGRWLRVDVASGQYTTPPAAAGVTVGYEWLLPQLGRITASRQPSGPAAPLPPPAAFCNASELDLSKDFYPLGGQPQFNDTFYVACPDAMATPGAAVTLSVTLTNPALATGTPVLPVRTLDNPKIVWEVSDGSQWHATAADYAFTADGQVHLTLPGSIAPATINGQQKYWLRARLAAGSYGAAASYKPTDAGGYAFVPPTVAPPVIKTLSVTATPAPQPSAPVTACLSYNDFSYTSNTAAAAGAGSLFSPFTPTADTEPALYLGFDQPFSQQSVTLFLEVEPPLPEQVAAGQLDEIDPAKGAQVTWEYASPASWQPLGALDETLALSRRGLVSFIGPADFARRSCFGQALFWLRVRWQSGIFPLPPQLRRVLLNTTWAAQVTTMQNEILGSGNGDPGQAFAAAQTPVQPGQQVIVREPQRPVPAEEQALADLEGADAVTVILDADGQTEEIWVRWHAVPDFYQSGPRDRHYTMDPLAGQLRFGDGSYGMIPPIGQSNIRITYQAGGGEHGNRASAAIVELKSSVPYVDGVTNNQPAQGGADTEPIDRLKARGPRVLRHRDRAVAAQDLEDLAAAASADVAAAAAIVPIFNPYSLWLDPQAPVPTPDHALVEAGRMGVIIVPNDAASARPTPSLVLLRQVQEYLQERCSPTADLWVAGPEWIAVAVEATLVVIAIEAADPAGDQARTALARYLHPLTGGPAGQGWPFGLRPHASELSALLEAVEGVDHVRSLTVSYQPETADPQRELALERILQRSLIEASDQQERESDLQSWLDRALIYSGQHEVSVALEGAGDQAG